ncbi:MAG: cytochrome c [Chitinophagales bacterium]
MKRIINSWWMLLPAAALGFFFYMSFFNAAYDHPGKSVYVNRCASCHGDQGEGIQKLVPPIASSDYLAANFGQLPCIVRNGINGTMVVNQVTYNQPMYPIVISDVEMANLMNYMSSELLHQEYITTAEQVAQTLSQCKVP